MASIVGGKDERGMGRIAGQAGGAVTQVMHMDYVELAEINGVVMTEGGDVVYTAGRLEYLCLQPDHDLFLLSHLFLSRRLSRARLASGVQPPPLAPSPIPYRSYVMKIAIVGGIEEVLVEILDLQNGRGAKNEAELDLPAAVRMAFTPFADEAG